MPDRDFSRVGGVAHDGQSGRGQPAATGGGAELDADTGEGLLRSAREGEDRSNQLASPIPPSPWRVRCGGCGEVHSGEACDVPS